MKKLITLLFIMAVAFGSFAQTPQLVNYQGVARDNGGTALTNQAIGLQLTIRATTANGTIVYQETQAPTTNQFGLFNIMLGGGAVVSGSFPGIDWGSDIYFIEVEMDETGGTNYQAMGTSQLISVPYALHADTAAYATVAGNGPAGPTGPAGATGAAGPQGVTGIQGPTGAANISGTTNQVIKFTGANTGGDSQITDDGTFVGIGNTSPTAALEIDNATNIGFSVFNGSTAFNPSDPNINNNAGLVLHSANIVGVGAISSIVGAGNLSGNYPSELTFWTYPNGGPDPIERVRIDDVGRLGIGTVTPSNALDVIGAIEFSGTLRPNNNQGAAGQVLTSQGAGTPTWTTPGAAGLWSDLGTEVSPINNENVQSGGDFYTNAGNGVINCGGGIMSATNNQIADVLQTPTVATADEDLMIQDDIELGTNGNGYKPGGGSWVATSDKRLKKDIRSFGLGLDQVLQIKPVWYKYNKKSKLESDREFVGVLAQDMLEIAPFMVEEKPFWQTVEEDENGIEHVTKEGENFYTFDPSGLDYMLINGMQEQQKMIEELKAEIELLKADR